MSRGCLVCGAELQHWFRKLGRDVYRCGVCHHVSVPAGLVRSAGGKTIYEGDEPVFCADGNEEYYLDESATAAAEGKADFVARHAGRGRLLDVGSGFGHFLAAVRDRYDATGIELSGAAERWGRERFGIRTRVCSVYDAARGSDAAFDAITSWDVIEHLEDPRSALQAIRSMLTEGGYLFLSTPDAGSVTARVMGRRWHYLDPLQHIHLFSRANLERVLRDEGFLVVDRTSFGRAYRIGYVLNRAGYLGGHALAGRLLRRLAAIIPGPLAKAHVRIKLWDVMGLAAVKRR